MLQVLNAIPDQDSFYDVADSLEEQGMDRITQRHMDRQGADLDLLTQFQIYEVKVWSTNNICCRIKKKKKKKKEYWVLGALFIEASS